MRIHGLHRPQTANMRRACELKLCRLVSMPEHQLGEVPQGWGRQGVQHCLLFHVGCGAAHSMMLP